MSLLEEAVQRKVSEVLSVAVARYADLQRRNAEMRAKEPPVEVTATWGCASCGAGPEYVRGGRCWLCLA